MWGKKRKGLKKYAKTISTLKYINEKFNSSLKLNKDSKAKGDYSEKRRD